MTTKLTTKTTNQTVFVILTAICFSAALAPVHAQKPEAPKAKLHYQVATLPDFGGTSSGGNSINDQSWAAGYSRFLNRNRHATLWRNSSLTDLGTLGGPNSSVTWNVKNTQGIIVGISQTADPEPLGEAWSSATFYSSPNNVGYINLGFVWQNNQMRGLPPFPGGNNGFATGANDFGQVVGWAENGVHDNACVSPQVLQFRPAMWTLGPPDQIQSLPLIAGDSSGAATAINDNGQIVGISGICDQAVGGIPPSMPCFGKMGPSPTSIQIRPPRGGIRRRQSMNAATWSGLRATRRTLGAMSCTLSCGPGRMASDS